MKKTIWLSKSDLVETECPGYVSVYTERPAPDVIVHYTEATVEIPERKIEVTESQIRNAVKNSIVVDHNIDTIDYDALIRRLFGD